MDWIKLQKPILELFRQDDHTDAWSFVSVDIKAQLYGDGLSYFERECFLLAKLPNPGRNVYFLPVCLRFSWPRSMIALRSYAAKSRGTTKPSHQSELVLTCSTDTKQNKSQKLNDKTNSPIWIGVNIPLTANNQQIKKIKNVIDYSEVQLLKGLFTQENSIVQISYFGQRGL